jgi:hypothetical protein
MNIERYLERFRELGRNRETIKAIEKESKPVIAKYNSLPLNLPISDEPMRRFCQVLTNNNFITFESCDGHGGDLPYVSFFLPRPNRLLGHLAYVISTASYGKHFPWEIMVYAHPGSIPAYKKSYRVEPVARTQPIVPSKDYEKLKEDIDILGITVLEHFNNFNRTKRRKR